MPRAAGRTTGIQIEWHYKDAIPATNTFTEWVKSGSAVDGDTTLIKYATGTPEVGAEASSATEAVFGQARKYEYATPGDPATFELMAEYDREVKVHRDIHEARAGSDCAVAALIKTSDTTQTCIGITGELKETKLQFDAEGLTKLVIPVAVDQIYVMDMT